MQYAIGGGSLLDAELIIKQANIRAGMKVADLGCGKAGYFIFPTAKIVGSSGMVYAVDIMKTILETIDREIKQNNLKNVKTVWSNLEIFNATKIESASLDAAYLINILCQSNRRVEILRESIRMLKKGARLLIVEWNNIALPIGPKPEDRVQHDLIMKAAPKLGLVFEEEFIPGQCHYGLTFIKQ